MGKNSIYSTNILTEDEVKAAGSLGANVVLCNEIKAAGPFDFETVDASQFRIEGGWLAYKKNEEVLKKVKKKWPGIFEFDTIKLEKAYQKALFWCNRKEGYLIQAYEKLYPNATQLNSIDLHPGKPIKTALMYVKYYLKALKGGRFNIPNYNINKSVSVGFLVEDLFEFGLFKNMIGNFKKEEIILVFPPFHRFKSAEIDELKTNGFQVLECYTGSWVHLPFTFPFKFNKKEAWMIQMMLNNLQPISQCLMWGEALFQSPIQILLTVAQENTPFGHILSEIATFHRKKVVNTMNGIKYGEGNDADTGFQHWMVWDEEMKKLLIEKVGTPADQLVVAGSLSQEDVINHAYSGSLPINEDNLKSKLIVSIISTRDLRPDKVEALTQLYKWADEKENVIILYRPHPSELEKNYFLPMNKKVNFIIIKPEVSKARVSLLDQLIASDLVINFGSTVSIESKWINTPCITYEKKQKSWLYCVDDKIVFHYNTPEQLDETLNKLQKKEFNIQKEKIANASEVYATHVKKWLRAIKTNF